MGKLQRPKGGFRIEREQYRPPTREERLRLQTERRDAIYEHALADVEGSLFPDGEVDTDNLAYCSAKRYLELRHGFTFQHISQLHEKGATATEAAASLVMRELGKGLEKDEHAIMDVVEGIGKAEMALSHRNTPLQPTG